MKTLPSRLLVCSIAPLLAAQAPVLDAAEVDAYRALRDWQQRLDTPETVIRVWARGFDCTFFGFDRERRPQVSREFDFDRDWASIAVLWPSRGNLVGPRALMANSLGHVFVSAAPPGPEQRPTISSVVADGVPEDLANMLLQSGTAIDGTGWRRVESLEGDVGRPQQLRLADGTGGSFDGFEVTIGHSRFRWHPGWLPLEEGAAVAVSGKVTPIAGGEAEFRGRGVAARGLHLSLQRGDGVAVLRSDDVRAVAGELLVVMPSDAMVTGKRLDEQAWAAEALRQLAGFELEARRATKVDADGDGAGEFGPPDEVVPAGSRRYERLPNGRFLFEGHLFELHLPAAVDLREQRFVAYAWPAEAVDRHDLAFAVDQRGVVFLCSAHERFVGHAAAPSPNAIDDAQLRWRPVPFTTGAR